MHQNVINKMEHILRPLSIAEIWFMTRSVIPPSGFYQITVAQSGTTQAQTHNSAILCRRAFITCGKANNGCSGMWPSRSALRMLGFNA